MNPLEDPKHDSKDIKHAAIELQKAWPLILKEFEKASPGYTLHITCSHRTPEKQFELYKLGRQNVGSIDFPKWTVVDMSKKVTNCDGSKVISKHNHYPAQAIDVCVVDLKTKKVSWKDPLYQPLGKICKNLGLTWGGNWVGLRDMPHIEVGLDSFGASSSQHVYGWIDPTLLLPKEDSDIS